jgi:hypothetical protein
MKAHFSFLPNFIDAGQYLFIARTGMLKSDLSGKYKPLGEWAVMPDPAQNAILLLWQPS